MVPILIHQFDKLFIILNQSMDEIMDNSSVEDFEIKYGPKIHQFYIYKENIGVCYMECRWRGYY